MMPKRTDISSILVMALTLGLTACGDNTSRSEKTTFNGNEPAAVADCLERFAKGGEVWGDARVRPSFVYDVTPLGLEGTMKYWKRSPAEGGVHSATVHKGGDTDRAVKKFLRTEPKGDTEMFGAEGLILLRVNDDPQANFDDALRLGCERLGEGITIRQVTFSKGKI